MNRGRGRGSSNSAPRGRGRGGGSGPGGTSTARPQPGFGGRTSTTPDSVPMDMVRPILPPLYPEYVDGVSYDYMDVALGHLASDFMHFNDYLKSNFSVHYLQKVPSGFEVDKYTDTYEQPLKVQPHLHHVIDKKFFPKELYTKTNKVPTKVAKVVDAKEILEKYTVKEEKRDSDSEDESDNERKRKLAAVDPTTAENLELKNAAKSLDPEVGDADDDDEDEVDEEMDEGNDYMNDYFDNGEGYLSEDDALEEGDVF